MLEDLKKLLFDLAKIVFAGVVVNSVMRQNVRLNVALVSGVAAVLVLLVGAFTIAWLIKRFKK